MKIVAIIDEFNNNDVNYYNEIIDKVRRETKADYILAAMSGDFVQQGIPATESKYARTKKALDAGIDLVVEIPVYATLQSPDTYAFGSVALLERLGCVDELAILCNTDQLDMIQKISMFLFMEPMTFQSTIRSLRAQGISFYDARAIAMEKIIPGSKDVLSTPENTLATEYGRAMKRMYSTMKPHYISVKDKYSQTSVTITPNIEKKLSSYLKQTLRFPKNRLNDTFGGTSMLTEGICSKKDTYSDFLDFANTLSSPTRSDANIRRYLLSLMVGTRKQDIAIARLYSFSMYARVIGCQSNAHPLLDTILGKSWMPVFIDTNEVFDKEDLCIPESILSNPKYLDIPTDSSKQMLLNLDHRAHALYYAITHE